MEIIFFIFAIIGIIIVSKCIIKNKSILKLQNLKLQQHKTEMSKENMVTSVILQGGLPTEALPLYRMLVNFVFSSRISLPDNQEGRVSISDKEGESFKNTNEYALISNFVKKFGCEYTQDDFIKLKELLIAKGLHLDDKSLLSLILSAKTDQDYSSFKKIILEDKPASLKDYIYLFAKNFFEDLEFLRNCKEKVNAYGVNHLPAQPEHNIPEQYNIIEFESQRETKFIPVEYVFERIVLLARKLFFLKEILIENNIEEFCKNNIINETLFKTIIDAKSEYDLHRFEKSLSIEQQFSIGDIDNMAGHEFENFLKKLFEKLGYIVEQTKLTGDQGADLILNKSGEKTVVQAKRSKSKISNGAVQEISASLSYYNATKGMVITNNYFTLSAIELAKSNKISLIDRDALQKLIKDII